MFENLKSKIEIARIERENRRNSENAHRNLINALRAKESGGQPLTAEESAILYQEDRDNRLNTTAIVSALIAIPVGIAVGVVVLNALSDDNNTNTTDADPGNADPGNADPGDVDPGDGDISDIIE